MKIFKVKKPDPVKAAIQRAIVDFFKRQTETFQVIGEDELLTIQLDGLKDIDVLAAEIAKLVKL